MYKGVVKQLLRDMKGWPPTDELARITPTHAEDVCFQVVLPGTLDGH
jgi:hypothetical protein